MSPTPSKRTQPMNLRNAFITLKLLYFGFMAGIALFSVVVVVLNTGQAPAAPVPGPAAPPPPAAGSDDMDPILAVLLGAWAVFVVPASAFILPAMRKRAGIAAADAASDTDPDAPKLAAIEPYTTAMLLRAALIEGGGLFGAVAILLTGEILFLIAPMIAIAILGLYFPTRTKFERFYTESLDRAAKQVHQ